MSGDEMDEYLSEAVPPDAKGLRQGARLRQVLSRRR
jgi:hypothetical protein